MGAPSTGYMLFAGIYTARVGAGYLTRQLLGSEYSSLQSLSMVIIREIHVVPMYCILEPLGQLSAAEPLLHWKC